MSLRTTAQYVAALKAEGCRVTGHAGWTEVNRPGPWDPHGVVVHHTGPYGTVADMIDTLRKGRSDLPGPLCHAGGRPGGVIDLVGWFDTNHAGAGSQRVLDAVLADAATPGPGPDGPDGNANFYGLELIHPGTGATTIRKDARGVTIAAPWTPEQLDAAVRYCSAVCRLHGWKATSVIFHKTWTARKVDPGGGFPSLLKFQARVAERLKHPASWSPVAPAVPPQPPIVIVTPPPPTPNVPDLARLDVAMQMAEGLSAYLARLAAGK